MYEERKEKFSFKSFFLTVLLVLLFVFLMLWLFPTKNYINNKLQSSYDLERLSVLYDDTFTDNLSKMKDAGIAYFTTDRLPKEVGESKKLTLQEMYNLHLILKLKDKSGNLCDATASYVEMAKYTDEYRLKVNLSCGNQQDYIIVYLGCYDYCKNSICEKKGTSSSTNTGKSTVAQTTTNDNTTNNNKTNDNTTNNNTTNNNTTNNNTTNNNTTNNNTSNSGSTVYQNIQYEYRYTGGNSYTCSGTWSNWQKQPITATDTVKVETKKEYEIVGYTSGYTTQNVTEKYISGYTTQTVLTGTKEVQAGTTKQTVTEQVAAGTTEKATGKIGTGTTVPANTSTIRYKVISTDTRSACSACANQTYYTWEEYAVVTTYKTVTTTKDVPVYKTINVYETKQVPVYSTRTVAKQVPSTTQTPQYGWVTYYRYRTCTINYGSGIVTRWSYSRNDANLINQGFVFTGNTRIS